MAKSQNVVERIVIGKDTGEDFVPNRENPNKWEMFKEMFMGHFTTMIGINLLTALFFAPAIVLIVYFMMIMNNVSALLPYSSNIGVGIFTIIDVASRSQQVSFYYNTIMFAILVPCLMVGFVGLAGNFYIMRKFAWGENVRVIKDFFRGVAKNWLSFTVLGLLDGLMILFFVFNLGFYDVYNLGVALKATMITISSLMLVVMAMITMFWTCQTVAYKLGPMVLLRNSFLFSFGTFFQTIAIIIVTFGFFALFLVPGIQMIIVMLFAFIGLSYISSAWTAYTHYCFDKFLPKEQTQSSIYVKKPTELDEVALAKKTKRATSAPVKYQNPKKKKKSIDDGAEINPLAPTFNREDLERLKREQEADRNAAVDDKDDELDNLADALELEDDKTAIVEDSEAADGKE